MASCGVVYAVGKARLGPGAFSVEVRWTWVGEEKDGRGVVPSEWSSSGDFCPNHELSIVQTELWVWSRNCCEQLVNKRHCQNHG